jgi:hypothetical protein
MLPTDLPFCLVLSNEGRVLTALNTKVPPGLACVVKCKPTDARRSGETTMLPMPAAQLFPLFL